MSVIGGQRGQVITWYIGHDASGAMSRKQAGSKWKSHHSQVGLGKPVFVIQVKYIKASLDARPLRTLAVPLAGAPPGGTPVLEYDDHSLAGTSDARPELHEGIESRPETARDCCLTSPTGIVTQ